MIKRKNIYLVQCKNKNYFILFPVKKNVVGIQSVKLFKKV